MTNYTEEVPQAEWDEESFLAESNAIEGVYDEDSLSQAIYAWEYLIKQKKLTHGVVLKTHKILMLNQPLRPDQRGYYRNGPVWIGGEEALHHSQIKEAMDGWLKMMNNQAEEPKILHVYYEGIHPFWDGNGRTGRMFMNWQRIKMGLPVLIIWEKEKRDYYRWFDETTVFVNLEGER